VAPFCERFIFNTKEKREKRRKEGRKRNMNDVDPVIVDSGSYVIKVSFFPFIFCVQVVF
jgi:hypothetical protein